MKTKLIIMACLLVSFGVSAREIDCRGKSKDLGVNIKYDAKYFFKTIGTFTAKGKTVKTSFLEFGATSSSENVTLAYGFTTLKSSAGIPKDSTMRFEIKHKQIAEIEDLKVDPSSYSARLFLVKNKEKILVDEMFCSIQNESL